MKDIFCLDAFNTGIFNPLATVLRNKCTSREGEMDGHNQQVSGPSHDYVKRSTKGDALPNHSAGSF